MVAQSYDIITVGGGIAASSLAMAMAGRGAKVLILEREKQFKDRVRGEAIVPWGVAEAHELGIYGLLKETCATKCLWSRAAPVPVCAIFARRRRSNYLFFLSLTTLCRKRCWRLRKTPERKFAAASALSASSAAPRLR